MLTILETIDKNAREHLHLLEDSYPHDEIAHYRRYIKSERNYLLKQHRSGTAGLIICRGQTRVLDHLIVHLYQSVKQIYERDSDEKAPVVAIVALGGYGRRELNPFSDIDLMFLHDGELTEGPHEHPFMKLLSEQLLYTLYDIPFKVGHSVRTLDECVEIANRDMVVKTSLIETRRIAGNRLLYAELQKRVLQECIKHHVRQYIQDRQEDQLRRHEKYGNSATMLEPNLKNGCGGLRDFHNLIWLAWFKLRTWNSDDLRKGGHLTMRELSQLRKAHDFLLRVRNELHFLTNRATDVLSKAVQPTVATHLGYTNKSPALRIEQFMQVLYTHMRNIHLISRTLEQRFALAPDKGLLPSLQSLLHRKSYTIDGFKVVDGWIRVPKDNVFKRDPGRLMRLFLVAQQRGLHLHPDLIHRLHGLESLSNDAFRRNTLVRDTFLDILHQRGSVAPVLRLMHETGLLGDYLPEFGKLTCLVQHEFFHRYTADEHTLMCIEQLDRIWQATDKPYVQFENIFQKLENPHILYLALLMHDVGKGVHSQEKHDLLSKELSLRAAKRMGLSESDTELLLFLVENHLYLFEIALHRDVYSPSVIREIADKIETPERLDLLFLLSFADTMGTSPELWNGFKELLLWTIYRSTKRLLSGNQDELIDTIRQRSKLLRKISDQNTKHISLEKIEHHLDLLSERYRRVFSPKQIAKHILMIQNLLKTIPSESGTMRNCIIHWERLLHQGCSRVTVCTYHQRSLFNKICGALTASGLTIFNAQIFVRQDGIALNSFHVLNVDKTDLPSEKRRKEFERILEQTLSDSINLEELILKHYSHCRASYEMGPREHFHIPTEITFDQDSTPKYTTIHVQSEDHIGLLYVLTKVLLQSGSDIIASSNFTEKGVAIDRFIITDCMGEKITDKRRLFIIETSLCKSIKKLIQSDDNGSPSPQPQPA